MKKNLVLLLMILGAISAKAQWDVSSAPVLYRWADNTQTILKTTRSDNTWEGRLETNGFGSFNFTRNLWVIGESLKLGKLAESYIEGLDIQYTDGGHGTTTFLHKRWGGNFWFKRSSDQGVVNQFYFGGHNAKMEIYNAANQVNVQLSSVGVSYFNGGNVGIGTTNPGTYKLAVEGKIGAREVKVTLDSWADFVFKKDYKLRNLNEVEQFIKENNHLPEIPSEREVLENGVELGVMQAKLLQKIEELTLYTIEQQKLIGEMRKELDELKK